MNFSGQVPCFVAEVSSNHNRDLGRARALIEKAGAIGCNAVKFQLFRIDQLFAPEILERSESHRRRAEWELPLDFLGELARMCHEREMQFACTPFYLAAVDELAPYVDFLKIGSYELTWPSLLRRCGETGLPVVLSTGMAIIEEVEAAVIFLRTSGCRDLTLLHTVSGYPTPVLECNLAAIETLRTTFDCPVGWSDHSNTPGVLHRAISRWGATMIEFHFDLDGTGAEYAQGHCWLPGAMASVISDTHGGRRRAGCAARRCCGDHLRRARRRRLRPVRAARRPDGRRRRGLRA
ncbi:MAG: N-acetylneuraminate synthase family protein, partial [Planctomycetes bacterium]|nr:N-acetylneuraminate synthase family protein [Planctomycetota bacterium]